MQQSGTFDQEKLSHSICGFKVLSVKLGTKALLELILVLLKCEGAK